MSNEIPKNNSELNTDLPLLITALSHSTVEDLQTQEIIREEVWLNDWIMPGKPEGHQ